MALLNMLPVFQLLPLELWSATFRSEIGHEPLEERINECLKKTPLASQSFYFYTSASQSYFRLALNAHICCQRSSQHFVSSSLLWQLIYYACYSAKAS